MECTEKGTGWFSSRGWRGGGCLALAIDPRFSRCKPGGFGAFLIVKRAFRIGRTHRRRLLAEKGDAELADPLARFLQLHRECDGVQFIPVFLMPAAVTVEDAVAGFRIDGSPERGRIGHAEHRAATIRDRTWLAQLQHGASIAQEERAALLHAGGAEGEGRKTIQPDGYGRFRLWEPKHGALKEGLTLFGNIGEINLVVPQGVNSCPIGP